MNRRSVLSLMAVIVTHLGWCPAAAEGQTTVPDETSIKGEILARYRSFEGGGEEQTWEKWQDYFIRSPNIANMHGDHLEIGWELYRDGSVAYYQRPPEERAAVRFEDIQVYVIDDRTAWATGVFVNTIGEKEMRPLFFDMLTKTRDGWQVFIQLCGTTPLRVQAFFSEVASRALPGSGLCDPLRRDHYERGQVT